MQVYSQWIVNKQACIHYTYCIAQLQNLAFCGHHNYVSQQNTGDNFIINSHIINVICEACFARYINVCATETNLSTLQETRG